MMLGLLFCATANADPFEGRFVGEFDGERYELSISTSRAGVYEGSASIGARLLALSARRFGDRIVGAMGAPGEGLGFVAVMQGNGLSLEKSDGSVIRLRRHENTTAQ